MTRRHSAERDLNRNAYVLRHLREGGWGREYMQHAMTDMTRLRQSDGTETERTHARESCQGLLSTPLATGPHDQLGGRRMCMGVEQGAVRLCPARRADGVVVAEA